MLEIHKDNFQQEVLDSPGLIVVDFWSPKCEPCMELKPHLEQLAAKHPEVKFCQLNIIPNRRTALNQKVFGLPAVVFYRQGKKVAELTREFEIEDVEAKLKELTG